MRRTKEETLEAVITAVSEAYGVSREEIMCPTVRRGTDARHMAYYVLHADCYFKYRELAETFGKGITTFYHGIRKTGRDISRYEDVATLHRLITLKITLYEKVS